MAEDFSATLTARQAGNLPDVLGLEWLEARDGHVKGRFTVAKHHMAPNGFLHAASVIALACQTARNRDPLSAPNRDPLFEFERRCA